MINLSGIGGALLLSLTLASLGIILLVVATFKFKTQSKYWWLIPLITLTFFVLSVVQRTYFGSAVLINYLIILIPTVCTYYLLIPFTAKLVAVLNLENISGSKFC